jgi:hypothetical protein
MQSCWPGVGGRCGPSSIRFASGVAKLFEIRDVEIRAWETFLADREAARIILEFDVYQRGRRTDVPLLNIDRQRLDPANWDLLQWLTTAVEWVRARPHPGSRQPARRDPWTGRGPAGQNGAAWSEPPTDVSGSLVERAQRAVVVLSANSSMLSLMPVSLLSMLVR